MRGEQLYNFCKLFFDLTVKVCRSCGILNSYDNMRVIAQLEVGNDLEFFIALHSGKSALNQYPDRSKRGKRQSASCSEAQLVDLI